MYFVPLTQLESVELLVHSLKAAAGEADCTMCPAYRVCMKQCLSIADSVEQMLASGTLPQLHENEEDLPSIFPDDEPDPPSGGSPGKGGLRVVK
jgi:hypothetical protein